MFFNVSQLVSEAEEDGGGGPEAGGQTVYIARGEDEELVTVAPGENTLSLVYRLEQLQIHKYFFLSSQIFFIKLSNIFPELSNIFSYYKIFLYYIFFQRDKDSLKFVKCVNSRLQGHFHDLALTYYE